MGDPPVVVGAVQEMVVVPSVLAVAETSVGADGVVAGVAVAGLEASELPVALVATTTKVYPVPFVSPWIVHEVVEELHVKPPVADVAV